MWCEGSLTKAWNNETTIYYVCDICGERKEVIV